MSRLTRADQSIFGQWWWTVDRWLLLCIGAMMLIGAALIAFASPPVALRLGLEGSHFIVRHLILLVPAVGLMLGISLLAPAQVRGLGLGLLAVAWVLVMATLFFGSEIKGATRWLTIGGLSLQPSELLKPGLAVTVAWLLARHGGAMSRPGALLAGGAYGLCLMGLLLQPDLGMSMVITMITAAQFVVGGLPWRLTALVLVGVLVLGIGAYFGFAHVQSRIDRFLNPDSGDTYQIEKSLQAFAHGGWFGVGPGEGTIKQHLPDAHTDFVFAVAGEETGLLGGALLVALFVGLVWRCLSLARREQDLFVLLAVVGLSLQIGLQAFINMGSAVHLLPTKGMTLPLMSYGGSSLLAVAATLGMLLALLRRRPDPGQTGRA